LLTGYIIVTTVAEKEFEQSKVRTECSFIESSTECAFYIRARSNRGNVVMWCFEIWIVEES